MESSISPTPHHHSCSCNVWKLSYVIATMPNSWAYSISSSETFHRRHVGHPQRGHCCSRHQLLDICSLLWETASPKVSGQFLIMKCPRTKKSKEYTDWGSASCDVDSHPAWLFNPRPTAHRRPLKHINSQTCSHTLEWSPSNGHDIFLPSSLRLRISLPPSSLESPHHLPQNHCYHCSLLTLHISLRLRNRRPRLHHPGESRSSNDPLSLRLYHFLSRPTMSDMQPSQTCSFKALQYLQALHLKTRSPLHFHQQLRRVWKPTLVHPAPLHDC